MSGIPSLKKFQSMVRKTVRMLYTDPLVHLTIDFIIDSESKVAESWSFAYLH